MGQRVIAEGLIFRQFADHPENWIIEEPPDDLQFITYGVDYGESTSHTVFVATGIRRMAKGIVALAEYKLLSKGVRPDQIEDKFVDFVKDQIAVYPTVKHAYAWCDHPETITNGIDAALQEAKLPVRAVTAKKEEIRIRLYAQERLFNTGRLQILSTCPLLIHSLKNQVWDKTKKDDVRLDNDPDVADVADAWEYSFEIFIDELGVRKHESKASD